MLALLLVACGNAAGCLIGGALERQHEFATRLASGPAVRESFDEVVAENCSSVLIASAAGSRSRRGPVTFSSAPPLQQACRGRPEIRIGAMTFGLGAIISLTCRRRALSSPVSRPPGPAPCRSCTPFAAQPRHAQARAILIGAEAALSVALLAGAALLGEGFYALQFADPGFDPRHVLTTRLRCRRYPAGPVLAGFYVSSNVERSPASRTPLWSTAACRRVWRERPVPQGRRGVEAG